MGVDVIVVGGGIIGCSAALALGRRGVQVHLLESADRLLDGVSSAGFGSLTPFSDPFFRGAARDFAARAVEIYRHHWIPTLVKGTGISIDVGDAGLLDLLKDDTAVARGQVLQRELASAGYPARLITKEEAISLEPELAGSFSAALWLDEPWIDPNQYFRALLSALGAIDTVSVVSGATVREMDEHDSSRVAVYYECSAGIQHLTADFVVYCTGLTSLEVGGAALPTLRWIRGDAVLVVQPEGRQLFERHVYREAAFMTPRRDGRLLLGSTYDEEKESVDALGSRNRDRISARHALHLLKANSEVVPAVLDCDVVSTWRGWRPTSRDGLPILGTLHNDSVVVATGFIGLGITMAPAVAEAIAAYVCDRDRSLIPMEFDPLRQSVSI